MVTGTSSVSLLPTGTIDSLRAVFPISVGMPSSPQTIRSPLSQIASFLGIDNGWFPVEDTWTYASASTITVPSGATSLYQKGWGIRFKQGGSYKYMYITTVASTLLTVNGGSDYSVANSAITDIAVCRNPLGALDFPTSFSWTPGYTGFSVNPSSLAKCVLNGNLAKLLYTTTGNGTSNQTYFTITGLPFTIAATTIGIASVTDGGVQQATPGKLLLSGGGTTITCYKTLANGAWTNTGAKAIDTFTVEFQI